jgi:hypothetical protein
VGAATTELTLELPKMYTSFVRPLVKKAGSMQDHCSEKGTHPCKLHVVWLAQLDTTLLQRRTA